jgi:lipopolysaccharide heptosyltransferase I
MLEARRVLLIRPSALGDVCRTVPALVSLRKALPKAHIDWLVRDSFADAVCHHPDLSGVMPFQRRGLRWIPLARGQSIYRFAHQLRAACYDMVIDLQGLARSGLFARLTGAKHRIGFANAREGAWLGYNRRFRVDASLHTVDRMLSLVEAAGFPVVHDMQLYAGQTESQWARQQLESLGLTDQPYACIAPTARWLCKCWPVDRYTEVAKRLLNDGIVEPPVIVLASPAEREQVAPMLAALDDRAVLPETTVGQLMALIAGARLVVCNDSAPLHIAVGFDRPLVTIFGPTDPALVGPYRREDAVVQPPGAQPMGPRAYRRHRDDQSLISQVTVDSVWERIVALVQ